MIDIDQIMIKFPDTDREELEIWIKDNPLVTEKEIINDINEGLFENLYFYDDLYKIWKSNNNGQGLTNQQSLWILKFNKTLLEYQQGDWYCVL
jgi:hypothetical protein